jgi:hypothetical protein
MNEMQRSVNSAYPPQIAAYCTTRPLLAVAAATTIPFD